MAISQIGICYIQWGEAVTACTFRWSYTLYCLPWAYCQSVVLISQHVKFGQTFPLSKHILHLEIRSLHDPLQVLPILHFEDLARPCNSQGLLLLFQFTETKLSIPSCVSYLCCEFGSSKLIYNDVNKRWLISCIMLDCIPILGDTRLCHYGLCAIYMATRFQCST